MGGRLTNSSTGYGWIAIVLHWMTAVTVFGLAALGLWMVDLDYYDAWYNQAPDLHRSIGILLAGLVTARLLWRLSNRTPADLDSHPVWQTRAALLAQLLAYVLLFWMFVSGYLISTAKGQPIEVFDLFSVPALITGIDNLEDTAGVLHEWGAWTLLGLSALHAGAALKHHFADRDRTLLRMLIPTTSGQQMENDS